MVRFLLAVNEVLAKMTEEEMETAIEPDEGIPTPEKTQRELLHLWSMLIKACYCQKY